MGEKAQRERRTNLAVMMVLIPVAFAVVLGLAWLVLSLLLGLGAD